MPTPSFCSWEAVHHQVAAALHLAPDELAPEWAHICAHAARRATAELRTIFTPRGYTPDQVAASADIVTYAHQLGTYFALTAGASLTDLDPKAIAWMDCRQELRDNAAIIIGEQPVAPSGSPVGGIMSGQVAGVADAARRFDGFGGGIRPGGGWPWDS